MNVMEANKNASDALILLFEQGNRFDQNGLKRLSRSIGNEKVARLILKIFAPHYSIDIQKASLSTPIKTILLKELKMLSAFRKDLSQGKSVEDAIYEHFKHDSTWDPTALQEKVLAKIIYYLTLYPIPALGAQQQTKLFERQEIQQAILKHETKCIEHLAELFSFLGSDNSNQKILFKKWIELERFIMSRACFIEEGKYVSWQAIIQAWGQNSGGNCKILQERFFQLFKLLPLLQPAEKSSKEDFSFSVKSLFPASTKQELPFEVLKKDDLIISNEQSFQSYLARRSLNVILKEHLKISIPIDIEKNLLSIFINDDETRRCALFFTFHLKSRFQKAQVADQKAFFHETEEIWKLTLTHNPSTIKNFLQSSCYLLECILLFSHDHETFSKLFRILYESNEEQRKDFRQSYLTEPHVSFSLSTVKEIQKKFILQNALETLQNLEKHLHYHILPKDAITWMTELCAINPPSAFLEFIKSLLNIDFPLPKEQSSELLYKVSLMPSFDLSKLLEGISWYRQCIFKTNKDDIIIFTTSLLNLFQSNTCQKQMEQFLEFLKFSGNVIKCHEQDFLDAFLHFSQNKITSNVMESMIGLSKKLNFIFLAEDWIKLLAHRQSASIPSFAESYREMNLILELSKYHFTPIQYGLLFIESFEKEKTRKSLTMTFREHWEFLHELEIFTHSSIPKEAVFNLLFCHALTKNAYDVLTTLNALRQEILTSYSDHLTLPYELENKIWETVFSLLETISDQVFLKMHALSYEQKQQKNMLRNHLSTIANMLSFSIFLPKNLLVGFIPSLSNSHPLEEEMRNVNMLQSLVSSFKESKAMIGHWKKNNGYHQLEISLLLNHTFPLTKTVRVPIKLPESLWAEYPDLWDIIAKAVEVMGLDQSEAKQEPLLRFGNLGEEFDFYVTVYPHFEKCWVKWSEQKKPSDVLMIKMALFSFVKNLKIGVRNSLIHLSQKAIFKEIPKNRHECASLGNIYPTPYEGLSLIPSSALQFTFLTAYMVNKDQNQDFFAPLVQSWGIQKLIHISLPTDIETSRSEIVSILVDVKFNPCQKHICKVLDDDDIIRYKEYEIHEVIFATTWNDVSISYHVNYPSSISSDEIFSLLNWQLLMLKSNLYAQIKVQ